MADVQFPKVKETRFNAKKHRREAELAHYNGVCRYVDRRDGYRCRACGHQCDPNAVGLLERAHRHHIVYRSAGGPDEAWNVCLLCPGCHDAQHNGLIDVRGNADEGLEIWRNDVDGWYMHKRELGVHRIEKD